MVFFYLILAVRFLRSSNRFALILVVRFKKFKEGNINISGKEIRMQKIPQPSKTELEDLLFNKMLSKKKLATYYGVCIGVIRRWMIQYNLVNKTPIELQKQKRDNTNKLKSQALNGKRITYIGFNSEFLEEYTDEKEIEKRKKQENILKRKEEAKARKSGRRSK